MKKLLLILLLISTSAYAEKYITEKDGEFWITDYVGGNKPIEQVLEEIGAKDASVFQVPESKLPKVDPEYWMANGKKIVVDEGKKQDAEELKAQKKAEKKAILEKLNISAEEFEKVAE